MTIKELFLFLQVSQEASEQTNKYLRYLLIAKYSLFELEDLEEDSLL
jgi:hypothetical protein